MLWWLRKFPTLIYHYQINELQLNNVPRKEKIKFKYRLGKGKKVQVLINDKNLRCLRIYLKLPKL